VCGERHQIGSRLPRQIEGHRRADGSNRFAARKREQEELDRHSASGMGTSLDGLFWRTQGSCTLTDRLAVTLLRAGRSLQHGIGVPRPDWKSGLVMGAIIKLFLLNRLESEPCFSRGLVLNFQPGNTGELHERPPEAASNPSLQSRCENRNLEAH
jgi:hypothetical protein